MIVSGSIHEDVRRVHSSRLSARLAELDRRRRAAELAVDVLLAAMSGDAASHFGSVWREWDVAATDAIDSLSALLAAIDLARSELVGAVEPYTPVSGRTPTPWTAETPRRHTADESGFIPRARS